MLLLLQLAQALGGAALALHLVEQQLFLAQLVHGGAAFDTRLAHAVVDGKAAPAGQFGIVKALLRRAAGAGDAAALALQPGREVLVGQVGGHGHGDRRGYGCRLGRRIGGAARGAAGDARHNEHGKQVNGAVHVI